MVGKSMPYELYELFIGTGDFPMSRMIWWGSIELQEKMSSQDVRENLQLIIKSSNLRW